jgi:hypothetical protein
MSTTAGLRVQTYVRYYHPGIIVSEETDKPIADRSPRQAVSAAPASAFAFSFFDVAITTAAVGGEEMAMRSRKHNESGRYYLDGERLDEADVEALSGRYPALLANMQGNGWLAVVRTCAGSYQPLRAEDSIIAREQS